MLGLGPLRLVFFGRLNVKGRSKVGDRFCFLQVLSRLIGTCRQLTKFRV